jgi:uncharacterized membrane protein YfcA
MATAAFIRYLYRVKVPHPLKFDTHGNHTGTLVDYKLTQIMLPMVLLGVVIGTVLVFVLPEIIITSLITVVLQYIWFSVLQRSQALRQNEQYQRRR